MFWVFIFFHDSLFSLYFSTYFNVPSSKFISYSLNVHKYRTTHISTAHQSHSYDKKNIQADPSCLSIFLLAVTLLSLKLNG